MDYQSPIDYLKLLNLSSAIVKDEAIILEIGSSVTKCGFSKEMKPRSFVATNFKKENASVFLLQ